jgi:hypothetical protein
MHNRVWEWCRSDQAPVLLIVEPGAHPGLYRVFIGPPCVRDRGARRSRFGEEVERNFVAADGGGSLRPIFGRAVISWRQAHIGAHAPRHSRSGARRRAFRWRPDIQLTARARPCCVRRRLTWLSLPPAKRCGRPMTVSSGSPPTIWREGGLVRDGVHRGRNGVVCCARGT